VSMLVGWKDRVLPDGPTTRGAATSWRVIDSLWSSRWSEE
jgi:hypothetical protein